MQVNTIENCNCLDGLRELPDSVIDLTVTSPPYDSLRTYDRIAPWTFEVFEAIAVQLYRVTKTGGVVVWIVGDETRKGSESGTSFRQALFFKELGFLLHDTMIWEKVSTYQHKNRYIPCFEYMFVFSKDVPPKTANLIRDRKNKYGGTQVHGTQRMQGGAIRPRSEKQISKKVKEFGARYNIWNMPGDKANKTGHPAVFPEQLATDHILTWSNPGDIVLDPFLGSGTTALAARNTGRRFLGFEVNPVYFQICKRRLEDVDECICESV